MSCFLANLTDMEKLAHKKIKITYCRAGVGGTPTADSRIAVPCPSDRNALRNPPRQHVPTVVCNFKRTKLTMPSWINDTKFLLVQHLKI